MKSHFFKKGHFLKYWEFTWPWPVFILAGFHLEVTRITHYENLIAKVYFGWLSREVQSRDGRPTYRTSHLLCAFPFYLVIEYGKK